MTTTNSQTSRIIVKNLPKWSTEEQIRKHFGRQGHLTDVKLMHTRSGIFRRFAYIGFANADEAATAVKYFNRTFIDTSRIQVEFAHRADSEDLSRPWSKYSTGSSANNEYLFKKARANQRDSEKVTEKPLLNPLQAELERKKKLLRSIYGEEDDNGEAKQLQAFVNASRPASKTKLWENDMDQTVEISDKKSKVRINPKTVEVKAVPNKKPGGQGQLVTKVHLKFSGESDEEPDKSGEESDELYEDFIGGGSTSQRLETSTKQHSDNDIECNDVNDYEAFQETSKSTENDTTQSNVKDCDQVVDELSPDLIADTGRLFVRNLSYDCVEDELRKLFEQFGTVNEVHIPISRETKKPKGYAYVLFMFPEHALKAYSSLDGTIFQGRIIHVLPAREKPAPKDTEALGGGVSSFQAKKIQEQKATAQKEYNWNSLFMRSDTVLDAIAAKLGVSKSSIMDVHSENLAARLAVAETNLIHETKAYLEAEGVELDAFVSGFERSNTVILVKNLPFDTEPTELRRIFEKFGVLGRVILPPTKAVALIEFFEASEARTAFKSLAYSKFKHAPLFLEWAPMKGLLPRDKNENQAIPPTIKRITESNVADNEDDPALSSSTTLYVKNLNFSTSSDTLKTVFSVAGPIRSAKIATKRSGDKTLSLGFGFVEFERKESLNRALDELQGHVVDGHALLLKKSSTKGATVADKTNGRKKSTAIDEDENVQNTKLVVRNIPFEANEKEVRELFKTFAQLKRVRLPRRFDGRHRGFGFVEFLTHQEAINARTALAHTHLYGRHLVLEWAKPESLGIDEDNHQDGQSGANLLLQDDQVEELREKTRKRMNIRTKREGSNNKRIRIGETDDLGMIPASASDED